MYTSKHQVTGSGLIPTLISLGGNLGDRQYYLQEATRRLQETLGSFSQLSALYETEAWGVQEQPAFLNQVGLFYTQEDPFKILEILQSVEKALGRLRGQKWNARTIDLDILYYGEWVINTETLKVPHPYIPQRRFILVPLVEISPQWVHPVLKKSQEDLLLTCTDPGKVMKWEAAP